jgi:DNA-binding MarR family transcriptional regulator
MYALLGDLERDGLVARVRDEHDRRRVLIDLTPAGARALKRLDDGPLRELRSGLKWHAATGERVPRSAEPRLSGASRPPFDTALPKTPLTPTALMLLSDVTLRAYPAPDGSLLEGAVARATHGW